MHGDEDQGIEIGHCGPHQAPAHEVPEPGIDMELVGDGDPPEDEQRVEEKGGKGEEASGAAEGEPPETARRR